MTGSINNLRRGRISLWFQRKSRDESKANKKWRSINVDNVCELSCVDALVGLDESLLCGPATISLSPLYFYLWLFSNKGAIAGGAIRLPTWRDLISDDKRINSLRDSIAVCSWKLRHRIFVILLSVIKYPIMIVRRTKTTTKFGWKPGEHRPNQKSINIFLNAPKVFSGTRQLSLLRVGH